MRKNRKTKAAACLLTALMCVATGCGGKDVSYNIDGDSQAAESSGIAGTLGVPESCDETFDTGESRLTSLSCADDDISVPESDQMKKVYYEVASYDADDVRKMVEAALDADKGIYVRESEDVFTKDEIQDMIDSMEEEASAETDESIVAYYEAEIESYKEQLADAPDELPAVTDYSNVYGVYTGEKNGDKYSISVQVYTGENENAGIYISYRRDDESQTSQEQLAQVDGAADMYSMGTSEVDADTDDMTNECQLSEDAAASEVMTVISDMGITGFTPVSTEPLAVVWVDEDYEEIETKLDGYAITLRRDFIGTDRQTSYAGNSDNLEDAQSDGYFYTVWDYIQAYVDDNGMVSLYGLIYSDYESMREEDVELLSWDEMLAAANENLSAYYVTYPTQYSEIKYNDVSLVYMAYADENGEKCFMPVWQFMEYEKMKTDNGDPFNVTQVAYINAIDGSVVDLIENAKGLGLWETYN